MGRNVKIVGITQLQKKLKQNANMSEVKQKVREHGSAVQTRSQKTVPVDTGTLKRSIRLAIKDNGLTSEVSANTDYAGYVEFGTRYMDAQPYMRPAYNAQKDKFKEDIEKLAE